MRRARIGNRGFVASNGTVALSVATSPAWAVAATAVCAAVAAAPVVAQAVQAAQRFGSVQEAHAHEPERRLSSGGPRGARGRRT